MSFRDQQWSERFKKLGDEAEGVFEYVCDEVLHLGFTRYGLNRPPLQMSKLPARLRYSPDYLMSAKFVEVQGCGNDQQWKLKLDKHGALRWWNDLHPVELFCWDTRFDRWCFIRLNELESLMGSERCSMQSFPEGKTYFSFDTDAVFDLSIREGELNELAAAA